MPYLSFIEVFTPLKFVGIRVFKCRDDNSFYIKAWNKRRKKLFKSK